jgi:CHAT domain-containing protein/Tfp pilus assembly protein PilF
MPEPERHGTAICQKKCNSFRIPPGAIADPFVGKPPPSSAPEIPPPKSRFYSHDRTKEAMQRSCFIGLLLIALLFFPTSLSYSEEIEFQEIEFQARDWQKARSCRVLAEELLHQGFFEASIDKFKEAVEIVGNASGNESPHLVYYLDAISDLNLTLGECENAEISAQRALKINEKAFGEKHVKVARSLYMLGRVYAVCGDYSKAEDFYVRALTIEAVKLGSTHSAVIKSSENLADLHRQYGYYDKAEPYLRYLKSLGRGALGTDNARLVKTLLDRGQSYMKLGKYAEAERLYNQALSISEKDYAHHSATVVDILHRLASLYEVTKNAPKATNCYTRAMEILEKDYAPGKPDTPWILDWMALTAYRLRDYSKAEYFKTRAIAEAEKIYGADDPKLATQLRDLGIIYRELSEPDKAESYFLRALKIHEKAHGQQSLQVAEVLIHLGKFYAGMRQYEKAVSMLEKALGIKELRGMEQTLETAEEIAVLSACCFRAGKIEDAGLYAERALRFFETFLGDNSPWVSTILGQILAQLAAANGDFEKSLDLFMKAENMRIKALRNIAAFATEDQKLNYVLGEDFYVNSLITLIARHLPKDQMARIDVFNLWLRRKGLVSQFERSLHKAISSSQDAQTANLLSDLCAARSQLSRLAFSEPGSGNATHFKTVIPALEARIEKLEIELSQRSGYKFHFNVSKEDCAKLAAALPERTVLVDFAKANLITFQGAPMESRRGLAHYFAFILPAKGPNRLQLIDLGEAKQIDNALAQFRKEIAHMDEKAVQSSRDIYGMIFDPIKREIGDAERLLISPDGDLHLIPFEVLQGPNGKYLIEEFSINYVAASHEILGFGEIIPQGEDNIIIGDPDFDMKAQEEKPNPSDSPSEKISKHGASRRSVDLADFRFKRLPHTKEEALSVQSFLGKGKAMLYTGREARESVLRQCRGPRILHLATHGFFLRDQQRPKVEPYQIALEPRPVSDVFEQPGADKLFENPMIRSGIALAGANSSLSAFEGQDEDGILTAEEILGLSLRGTDMVVLSACDTGLGDLRNGEGVFGLRRAFTLAGAKSLVMSLWSVPDEETQELMAQFYKNLQTSGMDRCQALRQAMLKEMQVVEERYGSAYPLCWGGFVFVGDAGGQSSN